MSKSRRTYKIDRKQTDTGAPPQHVDTSAENNVVREAATMTYNPFEVAPLGVTENSPPPAEALAALYTEIDQAMDRILMRARLIREDLRSTRAEIASTHLADTGVATR